jgi:hypothetical protein
MGVVLAYSVVVRVMARRGCTSFRSITKGRDCKFDVSMVTRDYLRS